MKYLVLICLAFSAHQSFAGTACTDHNTQSRIAREAVKSLIALADTADVVNYYGGVQENKNGVTVVNVQPHFEAAKDWYKVSIRNSDCRVLDIALFAENLPLE